MLLAVAPPPQVKRVLIRRHTGRDIAIEQRQPTLHGGNSGEVIVIEGACQLRFFSGSLQVFSTLSNPFLTERESGEIAASNSNTRMVFSLFVDMESLLFDSARAFCLAH